jgi:hypothetical protein
MVFLDLFAVAGSGLASPSDIDRPGGATRLVETTAYHGYIVWGCLQWIVVRTNPSVPACSSAEGRRAVTSHPYGDARLLNWHGSQCEIFDDVVFPAVVDLLT